MEFSRTFKDAAGREWTVEISLPNARRMRDIAGIAIEELAPEISKDAKALEAAMEPVQRFLGDPFRSFDAFWGLCKPQADAGGFTKEQVEEAFDDRTREAMNIAILRAVYDFFRWNSARQATLRVIAKNATVLMDRTRTRMEDALAKLDTTKLLDALPEIDAEQLNADAADRLKRLVIGSEDMSASTPKPIPGDN